MIHSGKIKVSTSVSSPVQAFAYSLAGTVFWSSTRGIVYQSTIHVNSECLIP